MSYAVPKKWVTLLGETGNHAVTAGLCYAVLVSDLPQSWTPYARNAALGAATVFGVFETGFVILGVLLLLLWPARPQEAAE